MTAHEENSNSTAERMAANLIRSYFSATLALLDESPSTEPISREALKGAFTAVIKFPDKLLLKEIRFVGNL